MRFYSHDFAFPGELKSTNDTMLRYGDCKTHITVLGNRSNSLQQNSAEADIVTDGLKLRNGTCHIKHHLNGVAEGKSAVLAFVEIRRLHGIAVSFHRVLDVTRSRY